VDAITQVLAKELGPKNIRVNSINPGMVETEGVHAAGFIGSDFERTPWRRLRLAVSDNRRISPRLRRFWLQTIRTGSRVSS